MAWDPAKDVLQLMQQDPLERGSPFNCFPAPPAARASESGGDAVSADSHSGKSTSAEADAEADAETDADGKTRYGSIALGAEDDDLSELLATHEAQQAQGMLHREGAFSRAHIDPDEVRGAAPGHHVALPARAAKFACCWAVWL